MKKNNAPSPVRTFLQEYPSFMCFAEECPIRLAKDVKRDVLADEYELTIGDDIPTVETFDVCKNEIYLGLISYQTTHKSIDLKLIDGDGNFHRKFFLYNLNITHGFGLNVMKEVVKFKDHQKLIPILTLQLEKKFNQKDEQLYVGVGDIWFSGEFIDPTEVWSNFKRPA